jgi:hypothetical protein
MLDSDVLLLGSPGVVLDHIFNHAGESDCRLITSFRDTGRASIVVPAIVILKKKTLNDFCKYLLSEYFDSSNRRSLVSCYFAQVGNGLQGGVSDMTAWSDYSRSRNIACFDLAEMEPPIVVDNFNDYILELNPNRDHSFVFSGYKCCIDHGNFMSPLFAIHFQGGAKQYMPLFSSAHSSHNEVSIRIDDIISYATHLPSSVEPLFFRIISKAMRRLLIFFKTGYIRV